MTAIGITGHQRIPDAALPYVIDGIRNEIAGQPGPVTGYSSLAAGADQLFAEEVVAAGGRLVAVVPCEGYEQTLDGDGLEGFRRLRAHAAETVVLEFARPSESAYLAAGKEVIDRSSVLIAVWDGEPARGLGGTGDAVAYARSLGKQVVVVWPEGVRR